MTLEYIKKSVGPKGVPCGTVAIMCVLSSRWLATFNSFAESTSPEGWAAENVN